MKDLITTKQLAERWGLHYKTLYKWRSSKKGPPFIKLGGGEKSTVYYRLKDVIQWERKIK